MAARLIASQHVGSLSSSAPSYCRSGLCVVEGQGRRRNSGRGSYRVFASQFFSVGLPQRSRAQLDFSVRSLRKKRNPSTPARVWHYGSGRVRGRQFGFGFLRFVRLAKTNYAAAGIRREQQVAGEEAARPCLAVVVVGSSQRSALSLRARHKTPNLCFAQAKLKRSGDATDWNWKACKPECFSLM